jgi:glycosyltransferase involved in cell wall biosynthesis
MLSSSKISIVIPTFNAGAYLGKCLESIALQMDDNIEVIVIDGGSSDCTESIVKSYSDVVSVFVSERDRGQGDAVTKGLLRADGGIFHWHAADDIVLPRAFRSVRAAFGANPAVRLVISDGLAFDGVRLVNTGKCKWISYRTSLFHFARFQSDCAYWASSITEAALPLDCDQPLSVDEDFFLRLWRGHDHSWLERPLGAFRMRDGQLSSLLNKDRLSADRRKTRDVIFQRDGIGIGAQLTACILTLPEHFLRNKVLPAMRGGTLFIVRKLTNDVRRKRMTEALSGFLLTADKEQAAAWYSRLEELMFD